MDLIEGLMEVARYTGAISLGVFTGYGYLRIAEIESVYMVIASVALLCGIFYLVTEVY